MCPNWESNQQPLGSQAGTQSTEPHQQGPKSLFKMKLEFPDTQPKASPPNINTKYLNLIFLDPIHLFSIHLSPALCELATLPSVHLSHFLYRDLSSRLKLHSTLRTIFSFIVLFVWAKKRLNHHCTPQNILYIVHIQ